MIVESWKFRCQQPCLVKHQLIATCKPAAILGKSKTKYDCIVDADESMRIILEGVPAQVSRRSHLCRRNKFIEPLSFGAQVNSYA